MSVYNTNILEYYTLISHSFTNLAEADLPSNMPLIM